MTEVNVMGIWTGKAGDHNPQSSVQVETTVNRIFYEIRHDSKQQEKRIVQIFVDGEQVETHHDWLSTDGKETNFFDIPAKFQVSGTHKVMFKVFEPETGAADAKEGELVCISPVFELIYF